MVDFQSILIIRAISEKTKHYLSDKSAHRTYLLRGCVAHSMGEHQTHR